MLWPVAFAFMASLALLAGCTEGTGFPTVESADWQPGYTYATSIAIQAQGDVEATVNGEETKKEPIEVFEGPKPWVSYEVVNAHISAGGDPAYLAVANLQATLEDAFEGLEEDMPDLRSVPVAFRARDLEPRPLDNEQCRSCASDELPTHPWLQFPLARGDQWTTRVELSQYDEELEGAAVELRAVVHGVEQVDGPSGRVDAVRIVHTITVPGLAEALLRSVREEGITGTLELDISAQRVLHYAPQLHNVVQDKTTALVSARADMVNEGDHLEGKLDVDVTATVRLVQADLATKPEQTLEEVLRNPKGPPAPTLPPTPTGVPRPSSSGSPSGPDDAPRIRLAADATHVNAATKPTVRLTAQASQASGLSIVVADATGRRVASGSGATLDWSVDEPGDYVATVQGRGPAGERLSASLTVLADWKVTLEAGCPTVAVTGVAACPPAGLPVRAGVGSVLVAADRAGAVPGVGKLVLTDAAGNKRTADMLGGHAEVLVTGADLAALGTWSMAYEPLAGIAEAVTYTIDVRHTAPSAGGPDGRDSLQRLANLPAFGLPSPAEDAIREVLAQGLALPELPPKSGLPRPAVSPSPRGE